MTETIKEKWQSILNYMTENYEVSALSYDTWLKPLIVHTCRNDQLFIIVPGDLDMFRDIISRKYTAMLKVSIHEVTGCTLNPVFILEDEAAKEPEEEKAASPVSQKSEESLLLEKAKAANLNPKYTFDTFVVGPSNSLAHAASVAVAESPGQTYKILYIYGGSGLGKTHLMHAVAHYILKEKPDSKILYATTETFTNDYVESIRTNKTAAFRNKYRDLDVLLIDDIQFIVGKTGTQEEFFHTFNALNEQNKQIIISSDKPPKKIDDLEERLRSRFEWGLTVDIQPPNFETRMAILRKKEEMEGYNTDDSVIRYIAENITTNIRELEGALIRIVAKSRLEKTEINVDMARKILEDLIDTKAGKNQLTPERIVSVVAEHFQIPVSDILSAKKTKEIAYPRQIAMYLCSVMTEATLQETGKYIGGRDHSTVIHGIRKIKEDMQTDAQLRSHINTLQKKLDTD